MTFRFPVTIICALLPAVGSAAPQLERIRYNNPDLVVDLGVGLWSFPLPMDLDGDGDMDLVVVCPDKPYNGCYFFENSSGNVKFPVFKPARKISKGLQHVTVSHVDGEVRVLSPGNEYPNFRNTGLDRPSKLPLPANVHPQRVRSNQWKYVDFDGDGALDLIVGVGDWTEYGWDDAYDKTGKWTNGPLHGYVYLVRNQGTTQKPEYAKPVRLHAGGKLIDVYGWPSPNLADFDGDGDLDLLCGEFLDGFTYFANIGTRKKPEYATGRRLTHEGKPLVMDLQMIVPVAVDWDRDGDVDLVVGDEDGRVALIEHSGKVVDGVPAFLPPRYFQQIADELKFGALSTPFGFDWDGDGDEDIICGNTAGYIGFFENLSGKGVESPRWAAPKLLEADGKVIRIQAGPNGSIQGPCEAKWGYTTLTAGDWDGDGLPDLVVNSIWGKVIWYRNIGTRAKPALAAAQPIEVAWTGAPLKPAWTWWTPEGKELATQWRTTPVVIDWNRDGLADLVMLDHEGYLVLFERRRQGESLEVLPGQRTFLDEKGEALQLNPNRAGKSGRRKLCITDWDGDGKLDILVNSTNANLLRQVGLRKNGVLFRDTGTLHERNVSGHTTSPTVVDWNNDAIPDLLLGSEDGRLYYLRNPRSK